MRSLNKLLYGLRVRKPMKSFASDLSCFNGILSEPETDGHFPSRRVQFDRW